MRQRKPKVARRYGEYARCYVRAAKAATSTTTRGSRFASSEHEPAEAVMITCTPVTYQERGNATAGTPLRTDG